MANSAVLIKYKRSSRKQNDEWEDYLKLKVYSFAKHSVERYYLKDITSDRLCFFKVQFVQEWKGVVLVYIIAGQLQAYKYSFETREIEEIARIKVCLVIDLDDIDTHCFLDPAGMLCFGKSVTYIDFSTSTVLSLDSYGSSTPCANRFPASMRGACMRDVSGKRGIYTIYEGKVTFTVINFTFPTFSYLFPMDAERLIRVGGRVYTGFSRYASRSVAEPAGTIDIFSVQTGELECSYSMPQPGVVSSALPSGPFIYFLWNIYSHALRLNTTDMSIRLCFLGDYFLECVKVLYLHRKGKLRLPLGLVREVCAFLAESRKVAERLSDHYEQKSGRNGEEGVVQAGRTPYLRARPYSAHPDKPVSASSTQGPRTLQLLNKPTAASTSKLAQRVHIYSPPRNREARSRPKNIPFDKERLYDEAQQLKSRNNELLAENLRLKTQVTTLEREISRKVVEMDDGRGQHLALSLKQNIKELKTRLKEKDEENEALRKDIRLTRLSETEAHVQTLEEECRRLLAALGDPDPISTDHGEAEHLRQQNNHLREEVARLNSTLRTAQLDAEQAQEEAAALERRIKSRKSKDNPAISTEIQKLKHLVEAVQTDKARVETTLAHKDGQIEALTRDKEAQLQRAREREQDLARKLGALEKARQTEEKKEELDPGNEHLLAKISELQANVGHLTVNLERERKQREKEKEAYSEDLQKHQKELNSLEEQHQKDLETQQKDLNVEPMRLKEELAALRQLSRELEEDREKARRDLSASHEQISSDKSAFAKEIMEKTAAISHLENSVAALRAELETMKQSLETVRSQCEREVGRLQQGLGMALRTLLRKLAKRPFRSYMEGMDWEATGSVSAGELRAGLEAAKVKAGPGQVEALAEYFSDGAGKVALSRLKEALQEQASSSSSDSEPAVPTQTLFSPELTFKEESKEMPANPYQEPTPEESKSVPVQSLPPASSFSQVTSNLQSTGPLQTTPREFTIENEVIPLNVQDLRESIDAHHEATSPDPGLNDSDISRPVAPEPPLDEMDGRHDESPGSVKLEQELTSVLRHVSMRFQINRIPCEELLEQLFGFGANPLADVNMRQLKRRLMQPPPSVKDPREQQLLALFVLGQPLTLENLKGHWDDRKAQIGTVVETLAERMGGWRIYSEEDEDEFDTFLAREIAPKAEAFRLMCEQADPDQAEYIPETRFNSILASLSLDFPTDVRHYLSLLFYSQDQLLDVVPYLSLLNAYVQSASEGSGRNSEDPELDKTKLLDQQLRLIAKALVDRGQTVRDVLVCDEQGLSRVEDLQTAMRTLGFKQGNSEAFRLLVESLQYEDTGCMLLADLEEVMANYGVDKLEYSAESLEKRQSGTLSEASPFRSTDFRLSSNQRSGGSPLLLAPVLSEEPLLSEGGSDRQS